MSYAEMLFEGASSQNLQLAKKLITETGLEESDLFPWFASFHFNPSVENPEMSIRFVIRDTLLKKMGFDTEKEESPSYLDYRELEIRDGQDKLVRTGKIQGLKESKIALDLLGKPSYPAYDWGVIRLWKLGKMEELKGKKKDTGFLVLAETGTVLFSDELKSLDSGEKFVAFHAAGIEGYLMETKMVFKVIDGELIKVTAAISD